MPAASTDGSGSDQQQTPPPGVPGSGSARSRARKAREQQRQQQQQRPAPAPEEQRSTPASARQRDAPASAGPSSPAASPSASDSAAASASAPASASASRKAAASASATPRPAASDETGPGVASGSQQPPSAGRPPPVSIPPGHAWCEECGTWHAEQPEDDDFGPMPDHGDAYTSDEPEVDEEGETLPKAHSCCAVAHICWLTVRVAHCPHIVHLAELICVGLSRLEVKSTHHTTGLFCNTPCQYVHASSSQSRPMAPHPDLTCSCSRPGRGVPGAAGVAALAAVRLAVGPAGVCGAARPGVSGGSGGLALRRPSRPVRLARVRLLLPALGGGTQHPICYCCKAFRQNLDLCGSDPQPVSMMVRGHDWY